MSGVVVERSDIQPVERLFRKGGHADRDVRQSFLALSRRDHDFIEAGARSRRIGCARRHVGRLRPGHGRQKQAAKRCISDHANDSHNGIPMFDVIDAAHSVAAPASPPRAAPPCLARLRSPSLLVCEHLLAPEPCLEHPCAFDALHPPAVGERKDVAVQHDEIGRLAALE